MPLVKNGQTAFSKSTLGGGPFETSEQVRDFVVYERDEETRMQWGFQIVEGLLQIVYEVEDPKP